MDNSLKSQHNLTNFDEIIFLRKKLEYFCENYKTSENNESECLKLMDFFKILKERKFLKDEVLVINVRV
jgi:hypothetical protein